MPRVAPLPTEDHAVGRRLRDIREKLLIPRTAMALKLGISSDRLASYEFGRVKLPWIVGKAVADTFSVNPIWLFEGSGSPWGRLDLDHWAPDAREGTFSEHISALLKRDPALRDSMEAIAAFKTSDEPPRGPHLNSDQSAIAREFASGPLSAWLDAVEPKHARAFVGELTKAGDRLLPKFLPAKKKK